MTTRDRRKSSYVEYVVRDSREGVPRSGSTPRDLRGQQRTRESIGHVYGSPNNRRDRSPTRMRSGGRPFIEKVEVHGRNTKNGTTDRRNSQYYEDTSGRGHDGGRHERHRKDSTRNDRNTSRRTGDSGGYDREQSRHRHDSSRRHHTDAGRTTRETRESDRTLRRKPSRHDRRSSRHRSKSRTAGKQRRDDYESDSYDSDRTVRRGKRRHSDHHASEARAHPNAPPPGQGNSNMFYGQHVMPIQNPTGEVTYAQLAPIMMMANGILAQYGGVVFEKDMYGNPFPDAILVAMMHLRELACIGWATVSYKPRKAKKVIRRWQSNQDEGYIKMDTRIESRGVVSRPPTIPNEPDRHLVDNVTDRLKFFARVAWQKLGINMLWTEAEKMVNPEIGHNLTANLGWGDRVRFSHFRKPDPKPEDRMSICHLEALRMRSALIDTHNRWSNQRRGAPRCTLNPIQPAEEKLAVPAYYRDKLEELMIEVDRVLSRQLKVVVIMDCLHVKKAINGNRPGRGVKHRVVTLRTSDGCKCEYCIAKAFDLIPDPWCLFQAAAVAYEGVYPCAVKAWRRRNGTSDTLWVQSQLLANVTRRERRRILAPPLTRKYVEQLWKYVSRQRAIIDVSIWRFINETRLTPAAVDAERSQDYGSYVAMQCDVITGQPMHVQISQYASQLRFVIDPGVGWDKKQMFLFIPATQQLEIEKTPYPRDIYFPFRTAEKRKTRASRRPSTSGQRSHRPPPTGTPDVNPPRFSRSDSNRCFGQTSDEDKPWARGRAWGAEALDDEGSVEASKFRDLRSPGPDGRFYMPDRSGAVSPPIPSPSPAHVPPHIPPPAPTESQQPPAERHVGGSRRREPGIKPPIGGDSNQNPRRTTRGQEPSRPHYDRRHGEPVGREREREQLRKEREREREREPHRRERERERDPPRKERERDGERTRTGFFAALSGSRPKTPKPRAHTPVEPERHDSPKPKGGWKFPCRR